MITWKEFQKMSKAQVKKLREEIKEILKDAKVIEGGKKAVSLPLDLIIIPPYQRKLKDKQVVAIAKAWNIKKCTFVTIALMEDGLCYVVDGQHRCAAAKSAGLTRIPCEIMEGLTFEECCRIFADQSLSRTPLAPFDSYVANLLSNDETKGAIAARTLYEVCQKYHIDIKCREEAVRGDLTSVGAPMAIARKSDGRETLDWIFGVLYKSRYYMSRSGMAADIIDALSRVYKNFPDNRDFAAQVLIETLEAYDYTSLRKAYNKYFGGLEKRKAIIHYFCKVVEEALAKRPPIKGKSKKGTI